MPAIESIALVEEALTRAECQRPGAIALSGRDLRKAREPGQQVGTFGLRRREWILLRVLQGDVHWVGHREAVAFRHVPDARDQLVLDGPSVFFRGAVDQAVLHAEVTVAQCGRDWLRALEHALGL